MMSDYLFGTGIDETVRAQNLYNKTYFYLFNYKSRYDYVPTWRGMTGVNCSDKIVDDYFVML